MTFINAWTTPKVGEGQCLCPKCGWSGKVEDCNPRVDKIALCPKCSHWVEYKDPPKKTA